MFYILVINPGSTSTKIAFFENDRKIAQDNINLDAEISNMGLWEQFDARLESITQFIDNYDITTLDGVAGRGGLIKPITRGTFTVNDAMLHDARIGLQGQHASNLGCALADNVAREWNCQAYIVDPVCVDEFEPLARYSGHPVIQRKSLSHALNIGATAFRRAAQMQKKISDTRFVIAHMGGGISVAAVSGGRIIDVNNAAADGPFTPERSGTLPMLQFVDLCFSGEYSKTEIKKMVMGEGGLKAYLGTADVVKIQAHIENGDAQALEIVQAMGYQIAKEIGAMSCVLNGQIDNIILTGGLTHSQRLVDMLSGRIDFIAPVVVFKGEFEMEALAEGVLRVLSGEEQAQEYK